MIEVEKFAQVNRRQNLDEEVVRLLTFMGWPLAGQIVWDHSHVPSHEDGQVR
jgi:hypothetical protein